MNNSRTFRLRKETHTALPGQLWKLDDDRYIKIEGKCDKFPRPLRVTRTVLSIQAVENNPEWFEEVFPLLPEYGTKEEVKAMKRYLSGK